MAVAFDAVGTGSDFTVTTVTTGAFTIAGTNRAAMVFLFFLGAVPTISSVTVGGVACSLVANTSQTEGVAVGTVIYACAAPPTGSQTASATWAGALSAGIAVITATGVDQTTPVNNGAGNHATAANSRTLTITSPAGDMSCSCFGNEDSAGVDTGTQLQKWDIFSGNFKGDIKNDVNATNPTHTWTKTNLTQVTISGANFKAAAVASDAVLMGGMSL